MTKTYLPDPEAFERLSRDWTPGTPEPPSYPCIAVWGWWEGFSGLWVVVEYVVAEDFNQIKKPT